MARRHAHPARLQPHRPRAGRDAAGGRAARWSSACPSPTSAMRITGCCCTAAMSAWRAGRSAGAARSPAGATTSRRRRRRPEPGRRSEVGNRRPAPAAALDAHRAAEHLDQRRLRCRIACSAVGDHRAAPHHQHPVGVQRQRQVVQHADDADALRRPPAGAAAAPAPPGAAGRDASSARRAAAAAPRSPARGRAARAGARRPTARAAGASARRCSSVAGHRRVDHRLVGRAPRRAEQAELRQPAEPTTSRAPSARRRPSPLPAPARRCGGRARAPASRRASRPSSRTLPAVEQRQPGEHAQQRRLAGAVGADHRRPAAADAQADAVEHRAARRAGEARRRRRAMPAPRPTPAGRRPA